MLRLLLESAFSGHGGLPFPVLDDASWYSEARLSSAFRPRFRADPCGEGHTHAEGASSVTTHSAMTRPQG